MRKKKVFVVGVTAPNVAHLDGQWMVTVVFSQQIGTYLKKIKRSVFTNFKPDLHTWIEVSFL